MSVNPQRIEHSKKHRNMSPALTGRQDPAEPSPHSMESPSPLRYLMQNYSKSRESVGKFFRHLGAEAAECGDGSRSSFDPSDCSPPAPKRGLRMFVAWKSSPALLPRQAKNQEASSTQDCISPRRVLQHSGSLPSMPSSPPAILGPRKRMLLPTPTALFEPAKPRSPPPRLSQTRSLPAMAMPPAILGPRRHMLIPTPSALRSPHEGTSAGRRLSLPLDLTDEEVRASSGKSNFLQTSCQPSELDPKFVATSRRSSLPQAAGFRGAPLQIQDLDTAM